MPPVLEKILELPVLGAVMTFRPPQTVIRILAVDSKNIVANSLAEKLTANSVKSTVSQG